MLFSLVKLSTNPAKSSILYQDNKTKQQWQKSFHCGFIGVSETNTSLKVIILQGDQYWLSGHYFSFSQVNNFVVFDGFFLNQAGNLSLLSLLWFLFILLTDWTMTLLMRSILSRPLLLSRCFVILCFCIKLKSTLHIGRSRHCPKHIACYNF